MMLRIRDNVFSTDILEKKFKCNLPVCLGRCCRYGDSGAPLSAGEAEILKDIWLKIMPYLRKEGISAILEKGTSEIDFEGDIVTPLIGNEECAYAILDGDIFMCGIEKAWSEKKIRFRKPLSCHLFPVRIRQYPGFKAVNYEELALCSSACNAGSKEGIFLHEFLKEPLIRALGIDVYNELCHSVSMHNKDI
jgi:hypothetical protein